MTTPEEVNRFHNRSDKDSAVFAQHHTLGLNANQASPGDHIHDGRTSKKILDGITVANAPASYTQAWGNQVVNALRRLGANP